jgi:hypothetical protein
MWPDALTQELDVMHELANGFMAPANARECYGELQAYERQYAVCAGGRSRWNSAEVRSCEADARAQAVSLRELHGVL